MRWITLFILFFAPSSASNEEPQVVGADSVDLAAAGVTSPQAGKPQESRDATSTQDILRYNATRAKPCTIKVSTSPNFVSVIHQLNTADYGPGADQDGQTNVGARWFVVGRRTFAIETQSPPLTLTANACRRSSAPISPREYPVVCGVSNKFVQGDVVTIRGMSNAQFNNYRTPVMSANNGSFTYYVTVGANDAAGDGTVQRQNAYSLALQANTTHFYRISDCVATPITGEFTTTNIPNYNLWSETFPTDANGNWIIPTLPSYSDTDATMTDPYTGVLIKRFSVRPPHPGYPGGFGVSASIHRCMPVADALGFYTCMADDGSEQLYKIKPDSGEVRYIGLTQIPSSADWGTTYLPGSNSAPFDNTDPNTFYVVTPSNGSPAKALVLKVVYAGKDVANPNYQTPWSHITVTNLTPAKGNNTLTDILQSFTAGDTYPYQPNQYAAADCSIRGVGHGYLHIECARWQQGSPAWNVVFNVGDGRPRDTSCGTSRKNCPGVAGAMTAWQNAESRWCGAHGLVHSGSYWVIAGLGDFHGAGNNDCGAYEVRLHSSTGPTTNSLTVDSNGTPSSPGVNGDPVGQQVPPDGSNFLDVVRAGDLFQFTDNNEIVEVSGVSNHTGWTVRRGCHFVGARLVCDGTGQGAHATGAVVRAICGASHSSQTSFYWAWLNDPHGTDTTNTNYSQDKVFTGGHGGGKEPYQIVEGPNYTGGLSEWGVRCSSGPLWTSSFFQQTANFSIAYQGFAGAGTACGGSACTHYPGSMDHDLAAQPWFMDSASFSGYMYPDTNAKVSGTIYRYVFARGHVFDANQPYFAMDGAHLLRNISAPESRLPNTGSYEFCVVHTAGECWANSAVGQVYADLPDNPFGGCRALETGPSTTPDFCVSNFPVWDNGVTQLGLTYLPSNVIGRDTNGAPLVGGGRVRKLVTAFVGPPRFNNVHDHVDPTGQWAFLESYLQQPNLLQNGMVTGYDTLLMAKIPPQPPDDGIDRTTWENVTIPIGGATGATHARVKYGYEEHGPRSSFHCAPYAQACVYSDTRLPLNSQKALAGVGAPGHILFYQVDYLDNETRVVGSEAMQATAVP